jgi:hypothetical protein
MLSAALSGRNLATLLRWVIVPSVRLVRRPGRPSDDEPKLQGGVGKAVSYRISMPIVQ